MQTGDLDEADRKRLERNMKQWKHRAEMSDEQRQEIIEDNENIGHERRPNQARLVITPNQSSIQN